MWGITTTFASIPALTPRPLRVPRATLHIHAFTALEWSLDTAAIVTTLHSASTGFTEQVHIDAVRLH